LASGASTSEHQRSNIRITINRIKAARAKETPSKDPNGEKSVFGQVYNAMRVHKPENLRGRKNQQLFQVNFLGEGSIDVGGPYRECMSNLCADLMSHTTPLFIECPNRKNDVGLNREKWVINPGSTSSLHLSMYEFVGILMGVALRTGETLNIDLPSLLWKQLLGEKVTLADLEAIDKLCVQALSHLQDASREKFDSLSVDKFTTLLSNGKEVEVKPNGRSIPVLYENRYEFVDLNVSTRLHESDQQVRAIRKGLNSIVPANMLSLFSSFDLEMLVCGNPEIDVDLLRKHTHYQGISAHTPLVKNMWRVLDSFNTHERQMFIRFVWGRSRLPLTESDWTQQFTLHALRAGDDKLPIAHTCFFSLELPMYSTYKIMRQKLLFAIFNCQAIDIDFSPTTSSLSAWVEE